MGIADDNISGSSAVAGDALEALKRRLDAFASDSPAQIYAELRQAAKELTEAQPEMAAVRNRVGRVQSAVQELLTAGAPAPSIRRAIDREVEEILRGAKAAQDAIAKLGAGLIGEGSRVLTFSSSSVVTAILLAAHGQGKGFEVVCLESRPMCEGALLARDLAEAGLKVTLMADAGLALAVQTASLCLVGADAVTQGSILNKLGTHALCLAARAFGIPVYCVFESDKQIDPDLVPDEAPKKPEEITGLSHPNLTVRNLYFERTPIALFAGTITEAGLSRPEPG
jgi:translation initiation factor 2B subunit (eIF-2B alpha/beta/delta family)